MKNFVVIGDPIKHSLSPVLHNWVYKGLNIKANYSKIHVTEHKIPDFINDVRRGKWDGLNITIPHKISIIDYMDEVDPYATSIGSINVVMLHNNKLIGNNTDWYGFLLALKNNRIDVNKKEVILIGSGGVSKAIIFGLKQEGVKKIHLFNRTFEKISHLSDEWIYPHKFEKLDEFITHDSIIINCTSLGMNANISPIKKKVLNKDQVIIDTIYAPLKTKMVMDAESTGARAMMGLDMFIYQALASIDLWFGEGTTNKVNFKELKGHIESYLC